MSQGSDLIALARSKAGQWYYTNDSWERMNPEQSGGTDCSGFVRWCYAQYGYNVGTWTGDESQAGYEVARGHYPSEIPWDDMQPGDLILMTATYWDDYSFSHYLCHIELYCGGGTMIGHPGGMGPQEKWAQAWMQAYGCITWMVRRVFDGDDDMNKDELIATRDSGNIPAWEAWSWAYTYAKDAAEASGGASLLEKEISTQASGNIPVWQAISWSYTYAKDVNDKLKEMQKAIDKLQAGGGSVDYDKLANAVADKLAARMKD